MDLPISWPHFFYYAGWADKLKYGSRAKRRNRFGVAGRSFRGIFPLLMAAWWKIAYGACLRQHPSDAQASRGPTTSLTALRTRKRNCCPGAWWYRHQRGRDRRGARSIIRTSTARVLAARVSGISRARRRSSRSNSAARRRTSCSRTRRLSAIEGVIQRNLFQPRPRIAAQVRSCSVGRNLLQGHQEGFARPRIQTLRVGNPSTRTPHRRDQFAAATQIREWCSGVDEGAG